MALGTMVARLDTQPTEHQLIILFSFLRTCHQVFFSLALYCFYNAQYK